MAQDAHALFEILIHEQRDMLWGYLRSAVYDQHAAEDLFQECVAIAWRRIDDFDRERPFGAWLRGIAGKVVLGHYRKSASRNMALCEEEVLDALASRYSDLEQGLGDDWNERLEALRQCLESLAPEDREIVLRHYHDNAKCKDIADEVKLGVEAVKKRLQRARIALAECIERKAGLEDVGYGP